jgi:hypothetical protein
MLRMQKVSRTKLGQENRYNELVPESVLIDEINVEKRNMLTRQLPVPYS